MYSQMFDGLQPCGGNCGGGCNKCNNYPKNCGRCGYNPCKCKKKKNNCGNCGYNPCKCKKKSSSCGNCGNCSSCVNCPCPTVLDCASWTADGCNKFISLQLTTSITPSVFVTAGTQAVITFTIKNTGNTEYAKNGGANVYFQSTLLMSVYPDTQGTYNVDCTSLCPGQSKTYTLNYTITTADLALSTRDILSRAYLTMSRTKCIFVGSNITSNTVTYGNADVTGTLVPAPTSVIAGSPSTFTLTLINLSTSQTNAMSLNLTLPYPTGITSAMIGATTTPVGGMITVDTASLLIAYPSLAPGASVAFTFVVTPAVAGIYSFSGFINTATFDPNTSNNTVVGTLTAT